MCGHHSQIQPARHNMSRRLCDSCRTPRLTMTRIRLSFCARSRTSRVAFYICMKRANCKGNWTCFFIRLFKYCESTSGHYHTTGILCFAFVLISQICTNIHIHRQIWDSYSSECQVYCLLGYGTILTCNLYWHFGGICCLIMCLPDCIVLYPRLP